jgi:hypothetical protein
MVPRVGDCGFDDSSGQVRIVREDVRHGLAVLDEKDDA